VNKKLFKEAKKIIKQGKIKQIGYREDFELYEVATVLIKLGTNGWPKSCSCKQHGVNPMEKGPCQFILALITYLTMKEVCK